MNTEQTVALIRKRFTNVTDAGDDILRAEQSYRDKLMGVFYFDFSQSPGNANFNLTEYVQKHLATDFYQHEGSAQWNYYLYFVVEKGLLDRLQKTGDIAQIESEPTFARKFVRDQSYVEEELKSAFTKSLYGEGRPRDIVSVWRKKLNEAGLGRMCDPDVPYTEVVREILLGKSSPNERQNIATRTSNGVRPGRPISKIQINEFRKYPEIKTFDFGSVNLIRGVNGTGKTSLLEAIELSICGGIKRQTSPILNGNSLLVWYEGEKEPCQAPVADIALYQAIDRSWYGGYYRAGNKLCQNFGRFNFFDSDAGFRLSESKSSEGIKQAMNDLFLGEEASTLGLSRIDGRRS